MVFRIHIGIAHRKTFILQTNTSQFERKIIYKILTPEENYCIIIYSDNQKPDHGWRNTWEYYFW